MREELDFRVEARNITAVAASGLASSVPSAERRSR